MTIPFLSILASLSLGFFIGSIPLGSWLVKQLSGKDVRELSAHNLGIENLLRAVGPYTALASFFIDVLKGFLVVLAFPALPWAALGVFLGHLYPLAQLTKHELPRGRGNGVLLGILAAWAALGLPLWFVSIPVLGYAALLAYSRYVALSTLISLVLLTGLSLLTGQAALIATCSSILALAIWRHKASIMRMIDGFEPKLGDPPAVFDFDETIVPVAFMIHPMSINDLWQAQSNNWLKRIYQTGFLSDKLLLKILPHLRPQVHGTMDGITLEDGRQLRVLLIGGPMMPEQIKTQPDLAVRMAIRGARLAQWQGAKVFGLGAFWSTVGGKGKAVQEAVPNLSVTNGGAYTAASIKASVSGVLESFEQEGGKLKESCAAVVGANGVVAFGIARTLAADVKELCLIGTDHTRLERSARTLQRKHPETTISVSTDMSACARADLIVSATSDPNPVIFKEHVKPGAWLFDVGRPQDVDDGVKDILGTHVIPGGVVRPPGNMHSNLDIHFGDGLIPACLAESMIMAATDAYDRASLGDKTKSANIQFYLEEAPKLGFQVVTRDQRIKEIHETISA